MPDPRIPQQINESDAESTNLTPNYRTKGETTMKTLILAVELILKQAAAGREQRAMNARYTGIYQTKRHNNVVRLHRGSIAAA